MPILAQQGGWGTHVCYSIVAIGEMPARGIAAVEAGDTLAAEAFTVAFLTHARSFIEFVAGRPDRRGRARRQPRDSRDITPDDFMAGWSLSDPTKYDLRLDEIDKHLAHLSKHRGTAGHASDGYFTDLARELVADLEAFGYALERAGEPFLANGFLTSVQTAQQDLAAITKPWPEGLAG